MFHFFPGSNLFFGSQGDNSIDIFIHFLKELKSLYPLLGSYIAWFLYIVCICSDRRLEMLLLKLYTRLGKLE